MNPEPLGLHALSGGNIIVSPSLTLTNAMLIIEGDTIVRVEEDLTPPTGGESLGHDRHHTVSRLH